MRDSVLLSHVAVQDCCTTWPIIKQSGFSKQSLCHGWFHVAEGRSRSPAVRVFGHSDSIRDGALGEGVKTLKRKKLNWTLSNEELFRGPFAVALGAKVPAGLVVHRDPAFFFGAIVPVFV